MEREDEDLLQYHISMVRQIPTSMPSLPLRGGSSTLCLSILLRPWLHSIDSSLIFSMLTVKTILRKLAESYSAIRSWSEGIGEWASAFIIKPSSRMHFVWAVDLSALPWKNVFSYSDRALTWRAEHSIRYQFLNRMERAVRGSEREKLSKEELSI